jgi:hypothetical protein
MIDFDDEEKLLDDGIWIVPDNCETLFVEGEYNNLEAYPTALEQANTFAEKYPDYVIASSYEVFGFFLLSKKPRVYNKNWEGSGFNHGSCNLLNNCPKRLLILAEND